jgi:xanthine dehydrogenase accessory factor
MEMYRKALDLVDQGRPFAMGSVVFAQGSTPQKVGSTAIIEESGATWGTLGGGLIESQALQRMRDTMQDGRAILIEYRLDEEYSREAGPICGGVMRILANPNIGRNTQCYRTALEALARGEQGLLVTVVDGDADAIGSASWVAESNIEASDVPIPADELRQALGSEEGQCATCADGSTLFLEPMKSPPRLLIVGGGHVGQAVAAQACKLGFETTVLDDRPEYTRPELFPEEVVALCGNIQVEVGRFPKDGNTYIVLVSKGHRPDAEALEACIRSDVAYLGMIGSERKIRFLKKSFIESGLATQEEFERVTAPIGLEIGAISVPEIGVSIAAQLVAARRLKSASQPLVHATSPK